MGRNCACADEARAIEVINNAARRDESIGSLNNQPKQQAPNLHPFSPASNPHGRGRGSSNTFALAASNIPDLQLLAKLYAFMIWKQASAFVMSCEWQEPNAVCSIGVSRPTVEGMMQIISRGPPVEFGPLIKLEPEQIGDELPALLPRRSATLSAETIAELEQIFGPGGELEAVT